jgi:CDP-diacylglycerol---glycerol-3-phosphate 3-phosphatidyltransferase
MKKHLPNALTLFRGVATIAIVLLFFVPDQRNFIAIYIFFLLAALSDYLDGYLARRWSATSNFGVIFDPLFDKLFVFTLIMLLFFSGIVHPLILLILMVRDVVTDVLKYYLLSRGILTPSVFSAKVKTAAQMLMLNFMLLTLAFPALPYMALAAKLSGVVAVIFSTWSGGWYVQRFFTLTRKIGA